MGVEEATGVYRGSEVQRAASPPEERATAGYVIEAGSSCCTDHSLTVPQTTVVRVLDVRGPSTIQSIDTTISAYHACCTEATKPKTPCKRHGSATLPCQRSPKRDVHPRESPDAHALSQYLGSRMHVAHDPWLMLRPMLPEPLQRFAPWTAVRGLVPTKKPTRCSAHRARRASQAHTRRMARRPCQSWSAPTACWGCTGWRSTW